MGNNKVRVEVVGMFPSYDEAIQGAMDELSQLARDHKAELARLQDEVDELEHRALHRMIMMETSFSGSEDSRNLSCSRHRSEIQRMLLQEAIFSESDNSQDLSGELSSDEEYEGPMDLHCEMCTHFLYTEFKLAHGYWSLI